MCKLAAFILCSLCYGFAVAYTQTDLLNAQTNFQAAKGNLDIAKGNFSNAQTDVLRAESELQSAKKRLSDAQKNLKNKQESEVIAKRNLETTTSVYKQSSSVVNNIWDQVNGKTVNGNSK